MGAARDLAARRRPVTLADLAREAGTSASTASRALSGRGYVSADVRERLVDAAERLGYVPNASARTLKQQTSRTIGVVVSNLGNQFYGRLAAGIEQTLRGADYQMVLVADNASGAEEVACARTFLAMRAPGVILTPVGREATQLLARNGVAVVEVDRRLASVPCDAVVIDNERGAGDATAHLLAAGHRRIGLLVGDTDWTSDAGRLEGFRRAHARAGVAVDDRLVVRIAPVARDVEARIGALLDAGAPTAIVAANNLLAEHAWHVLRGRGLRLPDDVSLVGFDDVPWMAMVSPPITVVAQPAVEMGRRAAELLLRRLADPAAEPTVERLQPTLVVRGSTAPAGRKQPDVARSPVLALDIGGTKLAAGVVDRAGRVHSFVVAPSDADRGPDHVLPRLFELGRRALAESGLDRGAVEAVGIGCGGPLDAERGVLLAPPHLPGWRDVQVVALAEEAFGRPAALENDATAAAAAEHRYGAGVRARSMVYLTISTGVGGGVVVDGRLYRGAGGNGGELGHVTIDWNGRLCKGCGRRGCLEAYVSGTSIAERAQEAGLSLGTAEEVAAAALAADAGAVAVWDETVAALACGLTSIVNLFEPELVVVGGGVARSGEQLLGPARAWVLEHAMGPAGRAVDIVPAALGDRVGVVGAAAIVFDRAESRG